MAEKPGKAKKEWIATPPDTMVSSSSPSRLVVSVPFEWEEKPGKPLQPPEVLPETPPPCLPPRPDHFRQFACYQNPFVDGKMHSSNPFLDEKEGSVFAAEVEAFPFETRDGALGFPLPSPWATEADGHSIWSSSAMDDVSMDTSVMEFLFPLSSSDTGSVDKVSEQERAPTPPAANLHPKLASSRDHRNESLATRRMLTLGELIALSRKLSYQLKQDDIRRSSYTMENIRESIFTCFPFMPRSNKNVSYITSW